MQEELRWKQRLDSYSKALKTLKEVVLNHKTLTELEKDGLVQRFEFTFELSWKVMQDYLYYTGYQGLKGPRNVIKQMAEDGLIDQFNWDEIMLARNELAHIYDEVKSRNYVDKIIFDYYPVFEAFEIKMNTI